MAEVLTKQGTPPTPSILPPKKSSEMLPFPLIPFLGNALAPDTGIAKAAAVALVHQVGLSKVLQVWALLRQVWTLAALLIKGYCSMCRPSLLLSGLKSSDACFCKAMSSTSPMFVFFSPCLCTEILGCPLGCAGLAGSHRECELGTLLILSLSKVGFLLK